jgi:phosphoglycerate dehydrogenase-like enzyme
MSSAERPRLTVVFAPGVRPRLWTDEARSILGAFAEVREVELEATMSGAQRDALVDEALSAADGLLLSGWYDAGVGYLSADRLRRCARLRFIGTSASDRHAQFLDVPSALEAGITITDTSRAMAPWVAEYELALILSALRRIPQEHAIVEAGGWVSYRDVPPEMERLQGRRVGLASFGAIHRHLVRLLLPFDVDWQAYDPHVPDADIARAGGSAAHDLREMAAGSEILCIATPPNRETIGVVSREVIEAVPTGGLVVVVSRLIVLDQDALIERVERAELRAATDVYEPEPPEPGHPLRRLPGLVHTPHRAGGTIGAHRAVFRETCREAMRFFDGEPVQFPLRPELVELTGRTDVLPD